MWTRSWLLGTESSQGPWGLGTSAITFWKIRLLLAGLQVSSYLLPTGEFKSIQSLSMTFQSIKTLKRFGASTTGLEFQRQIVSTMTDIWRAYRKQKPLQWRSNRKLVMDDTSKLYLHAAYHAQSMSTYQCVQNMFTYQRQNVFAEYFYISLYDGMNRKLPS